ncbi:MAG: hypothetical protein IKD58_17425 [Loktanella sp.]|nr:hypothetical protein [Loktanella sp.]
MAKLLERARRRRKSSKRRIQAELKRRKTEEKWKAKACKRISHGNQLPPSNDTRTSSSTKSPSRKALKQQANLVKTYTKYDNGPDHSKEIHLENCKEYQKVIHATLKNRVFEQTKMDDYKALIGGKGLVPTGLIASDMKARYCLGKHMIEAIDELHHRKQSDDDLNVYLVTFVDERFNVNIRDGVVEGYMLKDKVYNAIKSHTAMSALAFVENQVMVNYPKGSEGEVMCIHVHTVVWGYDQDDVKRLLTKTRGFKSNITKLPVHCVKMHPTEGSFSRVARYLAKPPYEGKEVDYRKYDEGKPCLFPARRVEKYQHLRLFEYMAKTPIDKMIFSVREGKLIRQKILSDLKAWHRKRKGTRIDTSNVDGLFERFYVDNGKLKRYRPMRVRW